MILFKSIRVRGRFDSPDFGTSPWPSLPRANFQGNPRESLFSLSFKGRDSELFYPIPFAWKTPTLWDNLLTQRVISAVLILSRLLSAPKLSLN